MTFPDRPGVYFFKDKEGKVIYVGKAKSLKNRVRSYFSAPASSPKTQALLKNYREITFITTPTELEALLLERKLIKEYNPYYNIVWKDDKQYPYIKVSVNEEWPRISVARKKEKDRALYFGPYEGKSVKETIRLLSKLFQIRQCKSSPLKKRKQPCLQFYIKRCYGPCVGAASREGYLGMVSAAVKILDGDLESAIGELNKEMGEASKNRQFEAAAKIRDRIKSLKKMLQKKPGWMPKREEKRGDTGIMELKNALNLENTPARIEAFDISNISGTNTVASMVVFENGYPQKSDYRRFNIKSVVNRIDDTAAIGEAVFRRYSGSLKDRLPKPQLVLIDGGIGQVQAAKKALISSGLINMPVISLAKREEEIYLPGKPLPLKLSRNSSALTLLQRIRDEAHRFAVKFHRLKRGKLD